MIGGSFVSKRPRGLFVESEQPADGVKFDPAALKGARDFGNAARLAIGQPLAGSGFGI